MRCKKHPSDVSSSVGVCATCLRERLFVLIAAQAQAEAEAEAEAQQAQLAQRSSAAALDHLKADPPPLVFPRSVSPYVARRKSDDTTAAWQHHNHNHNHHHQHHSQFDPRSYSTPQVGPTHTNPAANFPSSGSYRTKPNGRFSVWSNLFGSRSKKLGSDPVVSCRDSCDQPTSSSSGSSPSWFSSIFHHRRKKQSRLFSLEDAATASGIRRPGRRMDRGMSPERGVPDIDEDCDRSPSGSACSSESSQGWRRTPVVAPPSARRTRPCQGRNTSSLAFCLSPLVRASPSRQWNQKTGGLAPETAYSGELRGSAKPYLSTAASFCANRSRKLVDFGRVNHNR